MDPDREQISRAVDTGAQRIELYTGPFAATAASRGLDHPDTLALFESYADAARHAASLGLGVNAGHDLDLYNLPLFCRIKELAEVSIGHALIKDALALGLTATIAAYLAALAQP